MNKKRILGIGIDGVIRDMHNQFDKQYRKVFVRNDSLVKMDESFNYIATREPTQKEIEALEKKVDELINFPLDSFDLLNHYHFENREEFEKFSYEDYAFQIFGSAPQYPRAMDSVNMIQLIGEANNLYETVLISKEENQAIMSTYHFLSKIGCKIKGIKFVKDYIDKWEHCDVLIDDCPAVFENKPKEKISIKINHLYNNWSEGDYSFDSISEINNKEFLHKLFTKKLK